VVGPIRPHQWSVGPASGQQNATARLPIGAGSSYLGAMRRNTEKELQAALRAAEAELAAATKLSAVNAAARKLMRAKEALKRLQGEPAKPATRRAGSCAAPEAGAS
jgi:hypothetical protein